MVQNGLFLASVFAVEAIGPPKTCELELETAAAVARVGLQVGFWTRGVGGMEEQGGKGGIEAFDKFRRRGVLIVS